MCVCADIDECQVISGVCQKGRCVNTEGSFRCQCKAGFMSSPTGTTCVGMTQTHNINYTCVRTTVVKYPSHVFKTNRMKVFWANSPSVHTDLCAPALFIHVPHLRNQNSSFKWMMNTYRQIWWTWGWRWVWVKNLNPWSDLNSCDLPELTPHMIQSASVIMTRFHELIVYCVCVRCRWMHDVS